jgi:hypothetical protein
VYARLHTIDTTRERHDVGLELVRKEYLPWGRESTGFRGLIGLADGARERAIVITLWSDEEALDASAEAADRITGLVAAITGSAHRSTESLEVTLFDVQA